MATLVTKLSFVTSVAITDCQIVKENHTMLSTLSNVAKRHSLLLFFILAYALSWSASLVEPHGIFPFGPLVAALMMTSLVSGKTGLKTFLGRIIHWRIGFRWYALVLGLPLLINIGAVGLNLLLGAPVSATTHLPAWSDPVLRFIFIFFYIGLGEEPAWRGYALPRLLVGRSALAASLLLGLLHMVWHLPLFGLEYDLQNGLPWALSLIAFTVLTTWLYQHTQGSLLLPALFHTANNTTAYFFFWAGMFSGADLLRLWWLQAALWVGAAVVVILMTGSSLKHQPQAEPEPVMI
jgi:membrane protease YdiL (CAAX protease family)